MKFPVANFDGIRFCRPSGNAQQQNGRAESGTSLQTEERESAPSQSALALDITAAGQIPLPPPPAHSSVAANTLGMPSRKRKSRWDAVEDPPDGLQQAPASSNAPSAPQGLPGQSRHSTYFPDMTSSCFFTNQETSCCSDDNVQTGLCIVSQNSVNLFLQP